MVASNTSNIVSEGMHQPIGPCSVKMEYHFPGGFVSCLIFKNMTDLKKKIFKSNFACIPVLRESEIFVFEEF